MRCTESLRNVPASQHYTRVPRPEPGEGPDWKTMFYNPTRFSGSMLKPVHAPCMEYMPISWGGWCQGGPAVPDVLCLAASPLARDDSGTARHPLGRLDGAGEAFALFIPDEIKHHRHLKNVRNRNLLESIVSHLIVFSTSCATLLMNTFSAPFWNQSPDLYWSCMATLLSHVFFNMFVPSQNDMRL